MGIKQFDELLHTETPGLNNEHKLTLLAIALLSDENGVCTASPNRILETMKDISEMAKLATMTKVEGI